MRAVEHLWRFAMRSRIDAAVMEVLEGRRMMSATAVMTGPEVRSIDGTGNNVAHAKWGATSAQLLRLAGAAFTDGVSGMVTSRPSARVVSNAVSTHGAGEIPNARQMSAFAYLWGQFIDHD